MKIALTQGMYATIDDVDVAIISEFRSWCAQRVERRSGIRWYAVSTLWDKENRKRIRVYMHRLLCPAFRVDHADGDGLNNRRENLRPCTSSQNAANAQKPKGNGKSYSEFKGVSWHERLGRKKKWRAHIRVNGIRHHLGWFLSEESAAMAYDKSAREYFGKFARTNFA